MNDSKRNNQWIWLKKVWRWKNKEEMLYKASE